MSEGVIYEEDPEHPGKTRIAKLPRGNPAGQEAMPGLPKPTTETESKVPESALDWRSPHYRLQRELAEARLLRQKLKEERDSKGGD